METLTALPLLAAVALGAWCVLMIAAAVADEIGRMKHSEGKITVIDDRWLQIGVEGDPNATGIAVVADTEEGLEGDCTQADANAERLAVCWNACDGLEYPEAITVPVGVVPEYHAKFETVRDAIAIPRVIRTIDDVRDLLNAIGAKGDAK